MDLVASFINTLLKNTDPYPIDLKMNRNVDYYFSKWRDKFTGLTFGT